LLAPAGVQPANLDLTAHGGGGGDTMILNAMNFSTASGTVLNVDFSGDAGKDVIQFIYSVGIDGENGIVSFKKDQKHQSACPSNSQAGRSLGTGRSRFQDTSTGLTAYTSRKGLVRSPRAGYPQPPDRVAREGVSP